MARNKEFIPEDVTSLRSGKRSNRNYFLCRPVPRVDNGLHTYHLSDYDTENRHLLCNFQFWERGSSEPEHRHDCVELNFIVRGSGVNMIGKRRFPAMAGDLYVIRKGSTHAFYAGTGLEFYNLLFSFSVFSRSEFAQLQKIESFRRLFLPPTQDGVEAPSVEKMQLSPVVAEGLRQRFEQLDLLRRDKNEIAVIELKAHFMLLLAELCRSAGELSAADTFSRDGEHPALSQMLQYIHSNYIKNISVRKMASIANLSEGYVGNFFRVHTGTTLGHYIRGLRVELARSFFDRQPEMKVEEVAFRCGFDNANYFSRVFRQFTGISPERYKATGGKAVPISEVRDHS